MKKQIVTDLDGTLLKGSLVLQHYGYLVNKGMGSNELYNSWLADVKNEHLIVECAEDYQRLISGKMLSELEIDSFITMLLEDDVFTGGYHLIKNQDCMKNIISGSPAFLIEKLIEHLPCQFSWGNFGSVYEIVDNKLTGKILVPMFLATEKEKIIQNILKDSFITYGLGDTASDIPLIDKAEIKVLVSPTEKTLEYYINYPTLIIIK